MVVLLVEPYGTDVAAPRPGPRGILDLGERLGDRNRLCGERLETRHGAGCGGAGREEGKTNRRRGKAESAGWERGRKRANRDTAQSSI